jgi:hypothetical protein
MNEPDTTYWGALSSKQEGCHFSPGDTQSNTIIATRKALDAEGLNDVLVAGMDETDIGKSVTNFGKLSDDAKTALGRIDTHTYSGSARSQLKSTAIDAGKDLWMSEVDGGWNGFGLADRIILDMNGMQPGAWVMWDIVDKHKDSEFTDPNGNKSESSASLDPTASLWGVAMADHDAQNIELSNKYYAFGQFTRYINPGDTIIASSSSSLAAYNKTTGDIKIVVSNSSSADKPYTFDLSAFTQVGDTVTEIRSNNLTGSSAEHWAEINDEAELTGKKLTTTAKAATITTYVVSGNTSEATALTEFSANSDGMSYSYTLDKELSGANSFLAVYDSNGTLKYISKNTLSASVEGDFSGCTPKLMVWDNSQKPLIDAITEVSQPEESKDIDYGIINGGSDSLKLNSVTELTFNTSLEGSAQWSVSDESIAEISTDGVLTAKAPGSVTVYVTIGEYTFEREFVVNRYTLTGTASWGNDSNRPSDSADYLKAADGDLTTYFDGTQNGWVQYDYGTAYKISEIKLAARSGNGMPERTVGGTIQASNDGITWTDLYTITSAIPSDKYTTITADKLTDNYAYRFYRYTNAENMANIAEFLIDGEVSDDTKPLSPVLTDIDEFTDDFESDTNIFGADIGSLDSDGNRIFDSALDRYGRVFAPVKATASASLASPIELTDNDMFRMTFTMFAGWENNGKDNTFAIKDKDGNEIAALYMTGGGYNFNQIRIGGSNMLDTATVAQSRSNPGTSKAGANGWNASGQPYVNTVGYNKTVEITIDGTGNVSISATGGMADTTVSGTLSMPVSIGSIELTGSYNSARERVVSYDNLDADLITYSTSFAAATPTPLPTATP